ncbi:hypothetical protein DF186_20620, partial [Enterococcus hirae]
MWETLNDVKKQFNIAIVGAGPVGLCSIAILLMNRQFNAIRDNARVHFHVFESRSERDWNTRQQILLLNPYSVNQIKKWD